MPTILGVNFGREFFGGPETLEKQGRKIRRKNSPSKFAGNFPKIRRAKIKNSPQIRSAWPRDQNLQTLHQRKLSARRAVGTDPTCSKRQPSFFFFWGGGCCFAPPSGRNPQGQFWWIVSRLFYPSSGKFRQFSPDLSRF